MPPDEDRPASPLSVLLGAQGRDATGIVFVSTSDHRQVRIALDAGRIIHVGFGYRRGRIAAQFAASVTGVSATFSPGQVDLVDDDLPPERTLLASLAPMLSGGARRAANEETRDEHPSAPAGAATPAEHPPKPESDATLDEHRAEPAKQTTPRPTLPAAPRAIDRKQIAQIRSVLVEYVGPMAQVLVAEQLATGVQDLDTMIDRLAEQIGSARSAQAFRDAVRKQRR